MNCSALELDALFFSNSHAVHFGDSEAKIRLARKLGLVDRAIVDLVNTVGDRRFHDDVCIRGKEKCGYCHNR